VHPLFSPFFIVFRSRTKIQHGLSASMGSQSDYFESTDVDSLDELFISASSNAPFEWSHPPTVGSLKPTVIICDEHDPPQKQVSSAVLAAQDPSLMPQKRSQPTRRLHRARDLLKKKVKRDATLTPLANGEYFAILKVRTTSSITFLMQHLTLNVPV